MQKKNIDNVLKLLKENYPDAKCALNFKSPYELLVATILSAQCTDQRVNIVTSELFKKYNTPDKMVKLSEDELAVIIKSCGFYKNKSKNIMEASRMLIEKFDGSVPGTLEELTSLPGVGRKTANVVLANVFGIPAIAVDTHVFRVSNRIGIANGKTPEEVENQLMSNIPREMWSSTHNYLIWHGRKVCSSRKPSCENCFLSDLCEYNIKNKS